MAGVVQVICWKSQCEKQRNELLWSRLLAVRGAWQHEDEGRELIAGPLGVLTPLPRRLAEPAQSRDFK